MLVPHRTPPQPTCSSPSRRQSASGPIGWASTAGHRRPVNTDAVHATPPWLAVADGIGAHSERASAVALSTIGGLATPVATPVTIQTAIHAADRAVRSIGVEISGQIATSVVGVAPTHAGQVAVFHVGDSRCYRLAGGSLNLITSDHTQARELVDNGVISPTSVTRHPRRHVLARAIGLDLGIDPSDQVDAEIAVIDPPVGRLLLCTNGLSNALTPAQLGRVLTGFDDPQAAAARLIELVLEGPAVNNATALVVDAGSLVEHQPAITDRSPGGRR